MKTLLFLMVGIHSLSAAHRMFPDIERDNCEKVQALLTTLEEFKGPPISDHAFECKDTYLLDGFKGARVIIPGSEAKYWTVNMDTEAMPQTDAETKYLTLIRELMKCVYLNSWKAGEITAQENTYRFMFKQTISNTQHLKSILVSYYKLDASELCKIEITLNN
jgi:hypothetical protein